MSCEPYCDNSMISIVTIVYNGGKCLENAIRSVINQSYKHIEYIIIDGGSTDNTLDIINKYDAYISCWVSEPDDGIYSAMNKALALIHKSDSFVYFLNSDDTLVNPDVISLVSNQLNDIDFLYARINSVDHETGIPVKSGKEIIARNLLYGMACHHQSIFCRRKVFDILGNFNQQYKIAGDYDWVNRVFRCDAVRKRYVDIVVANMQTGGMSDVNYSASLPERSAVVATYFSRFDRLTHLLYLNLWERPRYGIKTLLRWTGLRTIARKLKYRLVGNG